jgi:hypothetical protein
MHLHRKKTDYKELDARLIGDWVSRELTPLKQLVRFTNTNLCYYGTLNVPYEIFDNGKKLRVNHDSIYHRISNESGGFIGIWTDAAEEEEAIYRPDGKYICLFKTEAWVYSGVYTFTDTHYTSFELREFVYSHNGLLNISSIYNQPGSSEYRFQGEVLEIKNEKGDWISYDKMK